MTELEEHLPEGVEDTRGQIQEDREAPHRPQTLYT